MGSFYTQRFWELICLYLPTDCFMKISLYGSAPSIEEKASCNSLKANVNKLTSRIFVCNFNSVTCHMHI